MTTLEQLLAAWSLRDARYGRRRLPGRLAHPLSPAEAELVRAYRTVEIRDLPPVDRGRAWLVLKGWSRG